MTSLTRAAIVCGAALCALECGGHSNSTPDAGGPPDGGPDAGGVSVSAEVGAEGGAVEVPDGASVMIPPGALSETTTITVSVAGSGFDTLPAVAAGKVYAFEPHGQTFEVPVTISIPHDQANPDEVAMYTSEPGESWSRLPATKLPGMLTVEVDHFSFFFNGREVCGLYRQECCESSQPDGQCAGDALQCVDNRCLECGLLGDACCGGTCVGTGLECHAEYAPLGRCYPPSPPPDAGFLTDAGLPSPDAGFLPDAGLASPDAGLLPDAGLASPDAGLLPDAGLASPDAGLLPDAGLP